MRQLIVSEFVTLDGVMEAPGGEPGHPHSGWVFEYQGPEQIEYKQAEVLAAGVLLVGRVTYESFAEAWPARTGAFADKMNAMPKVVVSSTLTNPTWNNTTVLSGDVVEGITRLKTQPAAMAVRSWSPGAASWSTRCSTTGWWTSCGSWCSP